MKLIEKRITPTNRSFSIYRNRIPCLDESWHYHQEFELIYIIKGTGMRFIGDDVREFSSGELVLLGSCLPHLWKNSPEYYHDLGLETDVIVVHFDLSFLGDEFFEIHEMTRLKNLFGNAKNGLEFRDMNVKSKVEDELIRLPELSGFDSIQSLLSIFNRLATSDEVIQIASAGYNVRSNDNDSERLNRIYQFVLENFHRDVGLAEVSDLANLAISPFCRFFKKRTHKSFTQFLNEVRVGQACKLLIENEMAIGQIAYSCGFTTQSNFNRQFRKIKRTSPREYKKLLLK